MQTLEQRLAEANDHFLLYVENARPLDTEKSLPFHQVLSFGPLVPAARFAHLLRLLRLGRYYLYNRVPMTLAHHAAMAFYAADLAEQNGDW
jgi:hypothetical protein